MNQISKLVREIIPVIIGILVALVINNWNEERKDKNYLDKIFFSIEKELEESKVGIEEIIPKQKALIDSLEVHYDNDAVSLIDIILSANGLQAPEIKTNAWKAIASSKIELMEYEKISALSDIEERKENLSSRIEKTADFVLLNLTETDKGKKKLLRIMTIDVINAEKRLQANIEELLKQ